MFGLVITYSIYCRIQSTLGYSVDNPKRSFNLKDFSQYVLKDFSSQYLLISIDIQLKEFTSVVHHPISTGGRPDSSTLVHVGFHRPTPPIQGRGMGVPEDGE